MIRISQAQENFVAARIFLVPYVNHVVGFVAVAKPARQFGHAVQI